MNRLPMKLATLFSDKRPLDLLEKAENEVSSDKEWSRRETLTMGENL